MLKRKKVFVQFPLETAASPGKDTEIPTPTPKHTKCHREIDQVYRLISTRNFSLARDQLRNFNKDIHGQPLLRWRRSKDGMETDETLLHICLMHNSEENVACIIHILAICPDLLMVPRFSMAFAGQTPLHIAVVTGNVQACEEILNVAERSKVKLRALMNARATGKIFNNSVMMGQIPLFVSALTFKENIVDLLLRRGASLFVRNGKGDNVFHTIIKYIVINRNKLADARRMITFLHKKVVVENQKRHSRRKQRRYDKHSRNENDGRIKSSFDEGTNPEKTENTSDKDLRQIWYMKNNHNLTSLQLAAKYGLVEIFIQILNLPSVYCFENKNDGLFDEKHYDITEVDSITNYKSQLLSGEQTVRPFNFKGVKSESVFEMMFGNKMRPKDIVEITEIPPLRGLIKLKWELYSKMFFAWMAIHLIFIILLSAYTVNLSELKFNPSNSGSTAESMPSPHQVNYVNLCMWSSFVYGLVYVVLGVTAIIPKFLQPNAKLYWKCNMDYISILMICGMGLLADIIWQFVDYEHNRVPLLISVLTGWWFNLFFLRGLKMFSFFTVMIKRVIFGDFLRFSVIIAFQLISFSASVHTMYQGKNVPSIESNVDEPSYTKSFDTSLFTMFNLMLGIGGINSTKVARSTWLTNSLYVVYILSTYILLVNALIAMMSSTCSFILQNKFSEWRIQQLSVILMLENCLHVILSYYDPVTRSEIIKEKRKKVYDPVTKTFTTQVRYLLDMKTLQNDMIEMKAEDIEEITEAQQKRNQESLNNNINKNILKRMAASAFFLPFVRQQTKPVVPQQESDMTDLEPDMSDLIPRPRVPAIFYEYLKHDLNYDSDYDIMNEELVRKAATEVFHVGRRGTVVEPFEASSSEESNVANGRPKITSSSASPANTLQGKRVRTTEITKGKTTTNVIQNIKYIKPS
ncbi:Transient receptor potential cation channel subfamily V member 6 [Mizuhopecten yessoensis]|uniref:Transient receptor potential cation channel subfamily V member 6 n=1 Tax=Mizuhopecten yessoensis TaxID=6573 RepID=A0A210PTZ8_MIZYE|nr:Transient receptor potential cation channel subfamily V member 6 [Mizuhopecten yessoensis]